MPGVGVGEKQWFVSYREARTKEANLTKNKELRIKFRAKNWVVTIVFSSNTCDKSYL